MKTCFQCQNQFEVTQMEMQLRAKCSPEFGGQKYLFPEPEMCEQCRYQQRIAHRNEWSLYHRKCDLTGKQIVSIYSSDKPFKVYDQDVWWSDRWDPRDYGREFDFNRSFFEQFAELQRDVPRLSIWNAGSENSKYTNQSAFNKDSYLMVGSSNNENCFYGNWVQRSKNCVDCYAVQESEWCYECVNGSQLYQCIFVNHSESTHDAYFSSDLKGCRYVFGCYGLRNKSYCIFNEQVSQEEWEERVGELVFTPAVIAEMKKRSREVDMNSPHLFYHGKSNENFSGDLLQNCKNTFEAFNCRDCEDNILVQDVWESQDCVDMTETLDTELCIGIEGAGILYGCGFLTKSHQVKHSWYCDHVMNTEYLFGCSAMHNQQYCILNQQYSKGEYEELVPRIVNHMIETGEWGLHFPAQFSLFGYSETIAVEYFQMSRDEVLERGWKWYDGDSSSGYQGPEYQIPESIDDVQNDISDHVLKCEVSGKPYKIIKQELEFYSTLKLPVPRRCFEQRRKMRMSILNHRRLFDRKCDECGMNLMSTYEAGRPERVLCEKCYQETLK